MTCYVPNLPDGAAFCPGCLRFMDKQLRELMVDQDMDCGGDRPLYKFPNRHGVVTGKCMTMVSNYSDDSNEYREARKEFMSPNRSEIAL